MLRHRLQYISLGEASQYVNSLSHIYNNRKTMVCVRLFQCMYVQFLLAVSVLVEHVTHQGYFDYPHVFFFFSLVRCMVEFVSRLLITVFSRFSYIYV